MSKPRLGGSFAPPLSDELLATYSAAIEALEPSALKDALAVLHRCATAWWNAPESQGAGSPHPLGVATIVPLDDEIIQSLWEHVPWREELNAMCSLCDAIPAENKALRDCAFHLLWHGYELTMDREPLTTDKLTPPA